MMLRSIGAGNEVAYAIQAISTIVALILTWHLWQRPLTNDGFARLSATLCLVMLATPYAYIYDLPALGFALAGYAAARGWHAMTPLTVFWIFTGVYGFFSVSLFLTGPIFLVAIAWLVWPRRDYNSASYSATCS